jgi:GxxExxY protein
MVGGDLGGDVTGRVIGAAIEVHRHLGPGFLEEVYEQALCHELALRGIAYERQAPCVVVYKGVAVGEGRLDLLVEDAVVVELKAVDRLAPIHEAQLLSYLKATGKRLGLLLNFNTPAMRDGIKRIAL